jgi:hypothetical protein
MFRGVVTVIALISGAVALTACAWAGAEMTPKTPAVSAADAELPIDQHLLITARAILAEGIPLEPNAGRRYSTTFVRADDSGRLQAYIYCHRTRCEELADVLLGAGSRVEMIRMQVDKPVIQAWIPAPYLRSAARLEGVEYISPPRYAYTH